MLLNFLPLLNTTSTTRRGSTAFLQYFRQKLKTVRIVHKVNRTVCWVWEHLLNSSLAEGRGSSPRHVLGILENFTPMWVFCQWGGCSCLDSWGAGGGTIVPQSGLFFFPENTAVSSFKASTFALLVSQLQLNISTVRGYFHDLVIGWTDKLCRWTRRCRSGSWQSAPGKNPSRSFLWPSPAGDLRRD